MSIASIKGQKKSIVLVARICFVRSLLDKKITFKLNFLLFHRMKILKPYSFHLSYIWLSSLIVSVSASSELYPGVFNGNEITVLSYQVIFCFTSFCRYNNLRLRKFLNLRKATSNVKSQKNEEWELYIRGNFQRYPGRYHRIF